MSTTTQPTTSAPAAPVDPLTTRRLTPGTRILVTDDSDYADGARPGNLRPARTARLKSWQTAGGEPAGIHAATVVEVVDAAPAGRQRRYTVRTNLGDVTPVTPMQRWRPVPTGMRDAADVRAEARAFRAAREAEAADRAARPRDVDNTPTEVGDLVELIDQGGGGRAGRPYTVTRVTEVGIMGPSGPNMLGDTSLMPSGTWRRLPDQTATDGTARRSCGCPSPIDAATTRDPNVVRGGSWKLRDLESAEQDRQHLPSCHWADTEDPTAAPVRCVRVLTETDEHGRTRHTVHNADGASLTGWDCGHGVEKYSGTLYDVRDRIAVTAAVYPDMVHPNRLEVEGRFTFADCSVLPRYDGPAVVARVRHLLALLGDGPTTAGTRHRLMRAAGEALNQCYRQVPFITAARKDAWYSRRYDRRGTAGMPVWEQIYAAYLGVDDLGDVEGLHMFSEIIADVGQEAAPAPGSTGTDAERPVSGRWPIPHRVPGDTSGENADLGAAEGAAWAAGLTAAELEQAITAREATGYGSGDGYNGAYTKALRDRRAEITQTGGPSEVFDPAAVRIERHSLSTTQREVSVFYHGELLGRFGDDTRPSGRQCCDGREPHELSDGAQCHGGWRGDGDERWISAARYEVEHPSGGARAAARRAAARRAGAS